MKFDATLNLVWALSGFFALATTAHFALRQNSHRRASRWLLIVGLIVTSLFPYISASDDILRMGHAGDLVATAASHSGSQVSNVTPASPAGHSHQADDLLRLYETLDAPLICLLVAITLAFLFSALTVAAARARLTRVAPHIAGRSPPSFVAC